MQQNKLMIASSNPGKIKEFKELFPNYEIESLIGKNLDIIEDGKTFYDNALIKARTVSKAFNCIALSDDSGLVCNGLDGRPGVYSARYAGTSDHDDNLRKVIKELENVEDKSAYFRAVICLYYPDDTYYFFDGRLDGEIIDEFRGENGFGYDKIFYLKEYGKTSAEIAPETKNKISHRSIAVQKLKESGLLD